MNPGATLPAMGRFKANQAWKLSFCEAGRVLLWRFQCSITSGAGDFQVTEEAGIRSLKWLGVRNKEEYIYKIIS